MSRFYDVKLSMKSPHIFATCRYRPMPHLNQTDTLQEARLLALYLWIATTHSHYFLFYVHYLKKKQNLTYKNILSVPLRNRGIGRESHRTYTQIIATANFREKARSCQEKLNSHIAHMNLITSRHDRNQEFR